MMLHLSKTILESQRNCAVTTLKPVEAKTELGPRKAMNYTSVLSYIPRILIK